ncbi:ATP-binding cassette, subfamily B [Alicyclobacillus tolerans]|uniref:ATP-binding cassette, subfamily B n=2 Tax=Alicyclobacillaceae TaxID=186823 RepID=A0A1M6NZD0_9BACL|nr:ATP-binding cassette, subfamily B [Alicyclobacillus montanus]
MSSLESSLMPQEEILQSRSGVGRKLFHYAKPQKHLFLAAFCLLIIATLGNVIGPILIQRFIDNYLVPRKFPIQPIVSLTIIYLGLQCISAICQYNQLVMFQRAALRVIQQLRQDVFSHVQKLGLAFFDKTPGGTLISRITNDTEAILDLFVSVLSTFIQTIVQLTGIFIAMFYLDAKLALDCLFVAPLLIFINWLYRKISSKIFHVTRHRLSLLNAKMNESLQGMYVIQAMRQQTRLQKEFAYINNAYRSSRMRNIRVNGLMLRPLVDLVYFATLIVIIWFFGRNSLISAVNIGVLYAFVNYLEQFFEPVNNLMQRMNMFQQAMVSAQRVFHLLNEQQLAPQRESSQEQCSAQIYNGRVEFQNVTFSYDGKNPVLKNISFVAEPGQTVALVGHTGSGKSSIVSLLMRFYSIEQGEILIDGQRIESFENDELRKKIGLVLQDPFLFVGDVASNIRLGRFYISDEQVEEAVRFVQADRFIDKLPHGIHEPLGERGSTLSAGERQLLSFARTMAGNPKILILDEATASVDTETEEAIQEALARMRQGRTTIAIAHRLSTIQDADLILVLHHGEIVERGTHQQLLAKQGLYYKMYMLQSGSVTSIPPTPLATFHE